MQKKHYMLATAVLLAVLAGWIHAQNADYVRTGTATVMTDSTEGSTTVTKDQSVWPTPTDRRGLYVIHVDIAAAGSYAAGAHALTDWTIPTGTILLEDAVIEVQSAVLPATATNALAVGGVTVLASGNTLQSTGIDAAVSTPGITTNAEALQLTISTSTATSGVFTVYLPVLMGNAGD